jgi:hypothetical protein
MYCLIFHSKGTIAVKYYLRRAIISAHIAVADRLTFYIYYAMLYYVLYYRSYNYISMGQERWKLDRM